MRDLRSNVWQIFKCMQAICYSQGPSKVRFKEQQMARLTTERMPAISGSGPATLLTNSCHWAWQHSSKPSVRQA